MKHYPAIDGLRGWMAWWVVCQHVLNFSGYSHTIDNPVIALLSLGGLAVMVFVIVSGFVITHLLMVRRETYRRYIWRRFMRIYPIYAVAVLLALVLRGCYMEVVALAPWSSPHAAEAVIAEAGTIERHIFLHATLLHGIPPHSVLSNAFSAILAPAWSLSLEWQFYLLAPMLLKLMFDSRRAVQAVAAIVMVGSLALLAGFSPTREWGYPAFLPLVIGFFLLGMATRHFLEHRRWDVIAVPLAVTVVNWVFYFATYASHNILSAIIPLLIWLAVIFASTSQSSDPILSRLRALLLAALAIKPVVKLGLWSYSTYLLHIPLFVLALWLAGQAGVPVTQMSYLLTLLATCPVLVALSWASYRFVEQRGVKWGNLQLMRVPATPAKI